MRHIILISWFSGCKYFPVLPKNSNRFTFDSINLISQILIQRLNRMAEFLILISLLCRVYLFVCLFVVVFFVSFAQTVPFNLCCLFDILFCFVPFAYIVVALIQFTKINSFACAKMILFKLIQIQMFLKSILRTQQFVFRSISFGWFSWNNLRKFRKLNSSIYLFIRKNEIII